MELQLLLPWLLSAFCRTYPCPCSCLRNRCFRRHQSGPGYPFLFRTHQSALCVRQCTALCRWICQRCQSWKHPEAVQMIMHNMQLLYKNTKNYVVAKLYRCSVGLLGRRVEEVGEGLRCSGFVVDLSVFSERLGHFFHKRVSLFQGDNTAKTNRAIKSPKNIKM